MEKQIQLLQRNHLLSGLELEQFESESRYFDFLKYPTKEQKPSHIQGTVKLVGY